MKYIVLLQANWYFSQNAGEECESIVIGVFTNKDEYESYLKKNGITQAMFDHRTDMGMEVAYDEDKSWYFVAEV